MSDSEFSSDISSDESRNKYTKKGVNNYTDKRNEPARKKYNKDKTLQKPCNELCPLNCTRQVNESQRRQVLKYFYDLGDITLRRLFIQKSVKQVSSNEMGTRAYQFYFTINGRRIQVCRLFFLSTLCIQIGFVTRAMDTVFNDLTTTKAIRKIMPSTPARTTPVSAGLPSKPTTTTPASTPTYYNGGVANSNVVNMDEKMNECAAKHIKSIPRVISCKNVNGELVCTEYNITVETMYDLYKTFCKTNKYVLADFARYKKKFHEISAVFRKCQQSLPQLEENDVVTVNML